MKKILLVFPYLPLFLFPIGSFVIGMRNLEVFQAPKLIQTSFAPVFLFFATTISIGFLIYKKFGIKQLSGLLLFSFFTVGYFLLASIFNIKDINTNNVYFAADNWSWFLRMADQGGWNVGTRAIHPYTHLIFRPVIRILSLLTNGERLYAMIILLALAGGGSVWLTWEIINKISEDYEYALIFSSIMGISSSHLIFASVIESYIFSTFLLLLFTWLLLSEKKTVWLFMIGILTFGVTVTNIAQQGIATLFIKKDLKRVFGLFAIIVSFGLALNIISKFIYPVTELLIIPENLTQESRFVQEPNSNRLYLVLENLVIYNITAPEPYLSFRNGMPRFRFLLESISSFRWFGLPAVTAWILLLIFSTIYFLKNIRNGNLVNHLSISLLLCLAFNVGLQIGYGIELFLYSSGWTYAVILFVSINLKEFFKNKFAKAGLVIFTFLLFINNFWFLYLVARKIAEYI